MVSHEDRNTVRLDVSNFGPIAEASVDLRPLTVFVGPSNTGKTYLATLTYALHRFFSGATQRAEFRAATGVTSPNFTSVMPLLLWGDPVIREEDIDREGEITGHWLQRLDDVRISGGHTEELPENVASIVRRQMRRNPDWDKSVAGELARCFGTSETGWLVRGSAISNANFSVNYWGGKGECKSAPLKFHFEVGKRGFKSSCSVSDLIPLRIEGGLADKLLTRMRRFLRLASAFRLAEDTEPTPLEILIGDIAGTVGATMVSPLSQAAHYLPADRTGVMHVHRVVVASTISSATTAGLETGIPLPRLSGVLSDFILRLLSLGNIEPRDEEDVSNDLGMNIEKRILSGEIRTDRSNPTYPFFSYLPRGWDTELPLMNASSMVSELAPVVLFLRHVVKPGEVLIIEEPESNLHPAMQVEFMRQLAAVVNSGVRIMITTHSEWILDELANLVRLSDLPPEKRTPRLKNEPALDPRDVGVWLFERGEGDDGSHVKELPLDLNQGGFKSGYEDTARLTYNQWVAIHNLLQG